MNRYRTAGQVLDELLDALHDLEVEWRSALPPPWNAMEHALPEWAADVLDLALADIHHCTAFLAQ